MPIQMQYDPTRRWLRTTARGPLTLPELLHHLDFEERRDHLGSPELFDAREATTDATSAEVRRLVARMRRLAERGVLGPTAFVADDDVLFGTARMYSALIEGFDPRFYVTRDVASAEQWLARTETE